MHRLSITLIVILFITACGQKNEVVVANDVDLIIRCGTGQGYSQVRVHDGTKRWDL